MTDLHANERNTLAETLAEMLTSQGGGPESAHSPVVMLLAEWHYPPGIPYPSLEDRREGLERIKENSPLALAALDPILAGFEVLEARAKEKGVPFPQVLVGWQSGMRIVRREISE